jgi:hypothetical protein
LVIQHKIDQPWEDTLMPKPYRFLAALVLVLAPALPAFALSNFADGAAAARVELGPILSLAEEATGHLAIGKGLGGDVLVAWAGPSQIRALRLAATGQPLGPPFVVDYAVGAPPYTPDPGWNMKVVPGVGNGFLVTWDDFSTPGGLFTRRVRGRENEIVEGFEIHSSSSDPAAVALPQGRFLVVYEMHTGALLAQRFDPDGSPVGPERELAPQGFQPAVVRDATGNVLIASFAYDSRDARRLFLWARRFTPDGTPLGESRLLDGPFSSGFDGRVRGATGTGGVSALTWDHDGRVRLQLIGADGSFRGHPIEVAQEPEPACPDVAVDAAGQALVVWADCCVSGAQAHARLWAPNGRPLGPAFVLSPPLHDDPSVIRQPAVAARDRGDFFIAWIGENGMEPDFTMPAIFGVRVTVRDP